MATLGSSGLPQSVDSLGLDSISSSRRNLVLPDIGSLVFRSFRSVAPVGQAELHCCSKEELEVGSRPG